MSGPYRSTAGPGHDLEVFSYERGSYNTLAAPSIPVPFGAQGIQILDFQNRHTEAPQVAQAVGYHVDNPLPFERFHGPFDRHVNEPQFLSVNETVFK